MTADPRARLRVPAIALAAGHWIGGAVRAGDGEAHFPLVDPATEAVTMELPDASQATVDAAVAAARAAGVSWASTSPRVRAGMLERLAGLMERDLELLADLETLATVRPIREMRAQLRVVREWFRYFAAIARTAEGSLPPFEGRYLDYVERRPLGVVAQTTPWNHPPLIASKKLAPALAAGNTVVLKPSELAPLSVLHLARLTAEAGLPAGVMNVVLGLGRTAGARLASAEGLAKIDLTGGTDTGRRVAALAGERLMRFTGELGGKAPVIIFDDIPAEVAAAGAAFAAFIATGQTCVQGARILVQRSILPAVEEALAAIAGRIRIGDPFDPSTRLGPLVSAAQRERTERYVAVGRAEGARVVTGGCRPAGLDRGWFYEPTVLADVDPSSTVAQEEIFGPVTCLIPFEDEADAIRLGNGTQMGLAASVWTRDLGRAHRVAGSLDCGIVWVMTTTRSTRRARGAASSRAASGVKMARRRGASTPRRAP